MEKLGLGGLDIQWKETEKESGDLEEITPCMKGW